MIFFKSSKAQGPESRVKPALTGKNAVAGLAAVAAMVAVNLLVARRTERRHPAEGSFLVVNGVRLHYTDRGKGPPIVLIHGNAVRGNDWDISGVTEQLLPTHRVIVFDRPGFGHSQRPRGRMWTAARQGDLLHDALDLLGVDRAVIVGHSWGSMVAVAFAERHASATSGLVLLSGYYFWTLRPDVLMTLPGALPVIGDLLRHTVSPLLGWIQMPLLKWSMFSPTPVPERFKAGYSTGMALRPSQIRATSMDGALMISGAVAASRHYEDLTVPVTIMAGDGDRVVFPRMSERLAAAVPGSILEVVEGAGHMIHYAATGRVVRAITQMVRGSGISNVEPAMRSLEEV